MEVYGWKIGYQKVDGFPRLVILHRSGGPLPGGIGVSLALGADSCWGQDLQGSWSGPGYSSEQKGVQVPFRHPDVSP